MAPARFERATYRLGICCSILLSYGTIRARLYGMPGRDRSHARVVFAGDTQPGEHGRVVSLIDGGALTLKIETSAAALCQTAAGSAVRARLYVYRGKLGISHPPNLEMLARD